MAQRGTSLAPDCYLWLYESSNEDLIVLGKPCELFVFAASTGTRSRAFTTRKRIFYPSRQIGPEAPFCSAGENRLLVDGWSGHLAWASTIETRSFNRFGIVVLGR
ncbi:hypothetical protein PsorP6_005383 [Peronosclerospora sorghi]|uniref:Uncharacterized protein n=1 Tax=Peronosclerospora sorghi TaxID=230839 RepID=A0ACC0W6L1_9STRA|nr:hypothetical protein PsorP6_005383 [Peronosclerospora sorghi]